MESNLNYHVISNSITRKVITWNLKFKYLPTKKLAWTIRSRYLIKTKNKIQASKDHLCNWNFRPLGLSTFALHLARHYVSMFSPQILTLCCNSWHFCSIASHSHHIHIPSNLSSNCIYMAPSLQSCFRVTFMMILLRRSFSVSLKPPHPLARSAFWFS